MKYALAGLAVAAAIAAFFFRPPQIGSAVSPAAFALPTGGASPSGAAAPSGGAVPSRKGASRYPQAAGRSARRARVVVYVAGEVRKPGVYALPADERNADALAVAGGPLPDADLVAVNLAAPLADGDEIAVPKIGAAAGRTPHSRAALHPRPVNARHGHGRQTKRSGAPTAPSIDLNSADDSELEAVPGIGPALAARIVEYRDTNGPFASIDELADVSGITPRLQDKLAEFVVIR